MRPSLPAPPPLLASDHLFWAEFSELRSLSRKSTEGARVKHVMHARTNEQFAVKEIDKAIRGREAIEMEMKALHELRHPGVVRLLFALESPTTFFMVTELLSGGELLKKRHHHVANGLEGQAALYSDAEVQRHIRSIAGAVAHMHGRGFVHRDLKPENVIHSDSGDIKLIDLGFARPFTKGQRLLTICGTHKYLAPELVRCHRKGEDATEEDGYDESVDVWGVGLLAFMLMYEFNPFDYASIADVHCAIAAVDWAFPNPTPMCERPSATARDWAPMGARTHQPTEPAHQRPPPQVGSPSRVARRGPSRRRSEGCSTLAADVAAATGAASAHRPRSPNLSRRSDPAAGAIGSPQRKPSAGSAVGSPLTRGAAAAPSPSSFHLGSPASRRPPTSGGSFHLSTSARHTSPGRSSPLLRGSPGGSPSSRRPPARGAGVGGGGAREDSRRSSSPSSKRASASGASFGSPGLSRRSFGSPALPRRPSFGSPGLPRRPSGGPSGSPTSFKRRSPGLPRRSSGGQSGGSPASFMRRPSFESREMAAAAAVAAAEMTSALETSVVVSSSSGLAVARPDAEAEARAAKEYDEAVASVVLQTEARAFISSILISDPRERPTAEHLLLDPWMKVSKRARRRSAPSPFDALRGAAASIRPASPAAALSAAATGSGKVGKAKRWGNPFGGLSKRVNRLLRPSRAKMRGVGRDGAAGDSAKGAAPLAAAGGASGHTLRPIDWSVEPSEVDLSVDERPLTATPTGSGAGAPREAGAPTIQGGYAKVHAYGDGLLRPTALTESERKAILN